MTKTIASTIPDAELSALVAETCAPKGNDWLIMKHGLYYRPGSRGYTREVAEAGRYSEERAKEEERTCSPDVRIAKAHIPPYATSLDAVLPLVKSYHVLQDFEPRKALREYSFQMKNRLKDWIEGTDKIAARAVCKALLRAHGFEITEGAA